MKHAEDMTGRRVKTYVVICRDENHDRGNKGAHWLLQCSLCGEKRTRAASVLKTRNTTRCKCIADKMKKLRNRIRCHRQSIDNARRLILEREPELRAFELELHALAKTDSMGDVPCE